MADSQRGNSLSPGKGKPMLERSNAHKLISYKPPTNRELEGNISEDDTMFYDAEDSYAFDEIPSMVGDWSINSDDYYTRKSRPRSLSSPRAPSPPLSPALVSPDSENRFEFFSDTLPVSPQVQGSFSFGRHGASDRLGAQTGETPVASTSYHPVAPVSRRPGVRSGELNPSWMTEGNSFDFTQDRFIEVGQAHLVASPGTPSRVSWMFETLPDQEDTTSFLGQVGDASPSRHNHILYTSVSAPSQSLRLNSPISSRVSVARDIVLSPPRGFPPYTRAISAPVDSAEEQVDSQHKGSQVRNKPRPQESSPLVPAAQSSHVEAPNDAVTTNAGSGGSDESRSGSGTTDDGDLLSTGLEEEALGIPWRSWIKLQRLGAGSFGTVYGGVTNNGTYFAVKEVPLDLESVQCVTQLEQEIAILSEFQHENIVQYLGTQRTDDTLYIFLELVTMGSLASLYKKHQLFAEQIQHYTRQILYGLKYLHEHGIVHRDVKCANILVATNGTAKLADFGMAKQISKFEEVKSTKGSAQWMAPEVIDPSKRHHLPADIWSLGCTVLEMAIGGPPFGALDWAAVFWKVAHGEAPSIPGDLDVDMKDFIKQCLDLNPSKRPTAAELLLHPFVNGQQGVPPSRSSHVRATMRGGFSLLALTRDERLPVLPFHPCYHFELQFRRRAQGYGSGLKRNQAPGFQGGCCQHCICTIIYTQSI